MRETAAAIFNDREQSRIILDSAATSHVVREEERIENITKEEREVVLANGGTQTVTERGDLPVRLRGGIEVTMENSLVIENASLNLFSVSRAISAGCLFVLKDQGSYMRLPSGTKILLERSQDGLFLLPRE